MYSNIKKALDYFSRKNKVLIHTPRADSLGNCAEDMFFGLLKAQRENKKILFLYPQNFVLRRLAAKRRLLHVQTRHSNQNKQIRFLRWILRNLVFRTFVANRQLFHIQSPYTIQKRFAWYLGGWWLTLEIVLLWVGIRPPLKALRKLLRLIWPRNPERVVFDFAQMTPTIGRSTLWNPDGVKYHSWEAVEEQNWGRQFDEYVPPRLMKDDYHHAERLRVQMGIPLTDWFVCLHARESGFHRDQQSRNRNASIHNYIQGIKVITAAGGWVVRIGDPTMTPLPPIENVIDYPHTRFKSELMDIYLFNQCSFFIGTNSGPYDVATLFGKPSLLVNATEWAVGFPLKKGNFIIIKHVFSRSRNRFLSISELLEEPFIWQDFGPSADEYLMVENTPEEIRDVIQEFLTKPEDYEYSKMQEAFNQGRRNQIHRWFDLEGATAADFLGRYRVAARCDSAAGTLGQRYLDQNWLVDNLDPHLNVLLNTAQISVLTERR